MLFRREIRVVCFVQKRGSTASKGVFLQKLETRISFLLLRKI